MRQPLQFIERDAEGKERFVPNAIVRFLLDMSEYNMNKLALMNFSEDDWQQFAQLIGYSVNGYQELSYVTDEQWERVRSRLSRFDN